MDIGKLVEILQGTIHPDLRLNAEKQLDEVHKIIGFAPSLLQVLMTDQVAMPVRQAAVIYMKNMVTQYWQERDASSPRDPIPFSIHESDKAMVRENIIEAIICSPDIIRIQLAVCLSQVLKSDYPGRWTGVVDKVVSYLQSDNPNTWYGALLSVYQLVKNYEYKKSDERVPLNAAMQVILPLLHQRCMLLMPDQAEYSVLMQKQILKILFALIQFTLPMELITNDMFCSWMEMLKAIVDRDVPQETLQIDKDERPQLIWWKCKKWAMHIFSRVFERYGSPGNVTKEYNTFADWYVKTFSVGILETLLKVMDQYRRKVYISPRVLQQTLNYLNTGVSHAISWKVIKPHMLEVTKEILFPLLCYTDDDDELWRDDPYEYIRMKFDVFEDFISPVTAAQTLLHSASKKRKQMMDATLAFALNILKTPPGPRETDGAMHIIGILADLMMKKKAYKSQVEGLLVTHIFPHFKSEHGYLRARANWTVHYFSEIRFASDANLLKAVELTKLCLLQDQEMPVKVEAAIALQELLSNQKKAEDFLKPHVKDILQTLLFIIRETENDDLTNVLQKFICSYSEDMAPIAIEVTEHLAQTFMHVVDAEETTDDKAITAMGLLNTMETLLNVVEDHQEIMIKLEDIVINVIAHILQNNALEFYEEALSLIFSLTCIHITPRMWQVYFILYDVFQKDGFDYFLEMMPALHNYITIDTGTFLSNPKHLEIIYNMCQQVFTKDAGEDAECHAAKLLEVILLQCREEVHQCIGMFVQLVLERLSREVKTSELRTICLQVVVVAIYQSPANTLGILQNITIPNSSEPVFSQFLKQWINDADCFLGLHDRKVCVLGICSLLGLPTASRPEALVSVANQFLPALLIIFKGLKRTYESRRLSREEEDDEDEDGEEFDEVLESDEDEVDEDAAEYLESLEKSTNGTDFDDEDDEEDDGFEETALEGFSTPLDEDDCPIDEYSIFKSVVQELQASDQPWYNMIMSNVNMEQQKEIQEVFTLADQRKAAADSKKIELRGGYQFNITSVPSTFNFGMP